ncbi:putative sugar reductase [Escherichia coli]|uniref:Putative sugar reductase n=1 Tax=Escherichia coli TaxID=562 RepID=A0A376VIV7_ECOLX|nr:putative sugar reductase [Escherichia coli]
MLNELKAEGKIRAIGAANVDADHIREYLQYGELILFRRNTVSSTGALESELLPLCRDNGIVVQVYSPLEQGLLTVPSLVITFRAGARANKVWFQRENMLKVIDMLETVAATLCSLSVHNSHSGTGVDIKTE